MNEEFYIVRIIAGSFIIISLMLAHLQFMGFFRLELSYLAKLDHNWTLDFVSAFYQLFSSKCR